MSEIQVLLDPEKIPDRASWQGELKEAQLPAVFGPMFDPAKSRGRQTVIFKGAATFFELKVDEVGKDDCPDELKEFLGDRNTIVTFFFGGDLKAFGASVSAAATLASLADGIYFDALERRVHFAGEVITMAQVATEGL